jgi:hypothetical protein
VADPKTLLGGRGIGSDASSPSGDDDGENSATNSMARGLPRAHPGRQVVVSVWLS